MLGRLLPAGPSAGHQHSRSAASVADCHGPLASSTANVGTVAGHCGSSTRRRVELLARPATDRQRLTDEATTTARVVPASALVSTSGTVLNGWLTAPVRRDDAVLSLGDVCSAHTTPYLYASSGQPTSSRSRMPCIRTSCVYGVAVCRSFAILYTTSWLQLVCRVSVQVRLVWLELMDLPAIRRLTQY